MFAPNCDLLYSFQFVTMQREQSYCLLASIGIHIIVNEADIFSESISVVRTIMIYFERMTVPYTPSYFIEPRPKPLKSLNTPRLALMSSLFVLLSALALVPIPSIASGCPAGQLGLATSQYVRWWFDLVIRRPSSENNTENDWALVQWTCDISRRLWRSRVRERVGYVPPRTRICWR